VEGCVKELGVEPEVMERKPLEDFQQGIPRSDLHF